MPNITLNLTKWYHFIIAAMPIFASLVTFVLWFDTRYMHREISNTRFNELQIRIIQSQVRDYHEMVKNGEELTITEQMQFDLDKDQLKYLMSERNKLLGIGDEDE